MRLLVLLMVQETNGELCQQESNDDEADNLVRRFETARLTHHRISIPAVVTWTTATYTSIPKTGQDAENEAHDNDEKSDALIESMPSDHIAEA